MFGVRVVVYLGKAQNRIASHRFGRGQKPVTSCLTHLPRTVCKCVTRVHGGIRRSSDPRAQFPLYTTLVYVRAYVCIPQTCDGSMARPHADTQAHTHTYTTGGCRRNTCERAHVQSRMRRPAFRRGRDGVYASACVLSAQGQIRATARFHSVLSQPENYEVRQQWGGLHTAPVFVGVVAVLRKLLWVCVCVCKF